MPSSSHSAGRVYHVQEVLGRGGFGTVYRADLVSEGGFTKPVALKVLHPDAAARADHLARLRDEARMLGLVRHRALVGADALVRLDGRWTVVMEFVPGVSLRALHKRLGAVPEAVVVAIGAEIADALHAAWSAEREPGRPLHLVHRDLKPSNLQLTDRGELKVLDFGVARAEFDEREAHTRQVVYGSPPYLSPERLEGVDTHEGDVFALGISLCELLSGRSAEPVAIKPAAHEARIAHLLEGLVLDPTFRALLDQMLAYEHEARPSALEVLQVLRPLSHRQPEALAAWAAEQVPQELRAQGEMPGELSGMRLAEESGAASLQALAAGSLATWDDPTATRPTTPGPDPGADASATWDADIADLSLPTAPEPPPAPAPATPRWLRWMAVLGVLLSGVAVVMLLVLGVLGLTAASAGWAFLGFVDDRGCEGSVARMEQRVEWCSGQERWQTKTQALLHRTQRACLTDDITLVEASLLSMALEQLTDDRVLDRADYDALKDRFDKALPPSR